VGGLQVWRAGGAGGHAGQGKKLSEASCGLSDRMGIGAGLGGQTGITAAGCKNGGLAAGRLAGKRRQGHETSLTGDFVSNQMRLSAGCAAPAPSVANKADDLPGSAEARPT
jgi:hypothetical protein